LAKSVLGDADTAWCGNALEPSGDVDPIAEYVLPFDKDIADMNADPPFHAAGIGNSRIALRGQLLQCQGTFDGANHGAEFYQGPIASGFDNPPTMLGNERVGDAAVVT
jgi:hypothetical protein